MSVPARISLTVLGVRDLPAAVAFYQAIGWRRSVQASNEAIAFFDTADGVLALFPWDELAADAGVEAAGTGFRGVAHAINCESREAVDASVAELVAAGATMVKAPVAAVWGGYSGYVADPDGHLWEVAHNPTLPFSDDGSIDLPR
jgi:predicted lactoylglutathione lyase